MARHISGYNVSFAGRAQRFDARSLLLAIVFVACQIGLVLAAWNVSPEAENSENSTADSVSVIAVADLPPTPKKPAPPAREVAAQGAPPGQSVAADRLAPPAVAEPVAITIADLTLQRLPADPITSPVELVTGGSRGPDSGNGAAAGAGDGAGGSGGAEGTGAAPELTVQWSPNMRFERLRSYYPRRARRDALDGFVQLDCMAITRDRVRDCRLVQEIPRGENFGASALGSAHLYRIIVTNQNGERVYGERVTIDYNFRVTD